MQFSSYVCTLHLRPHVSSLENTHFIHSRVARSFRLYYLSKQNIATNPLTLYLLDRFGYRRDDALLDDDARLRGVLERLLGQELGADGQPEAALVLGPALVLVGELGGEVFVVLCVVCKSFTLLAKKKKIFLVMDK